jgi:hypothetical protein
VFIFYFCFLVYFKGFACFRSRGAINSGAWSEKQKASMESVAGVEARVEVSGACVEYVEGVEGERLVDAGDAAVAAHGGEGRV